MIGVRVSLTVAQKEVFHFQHTNYTHHPNVSWGARTGRWVLVHFEPHFDRNSFKAIVSVGCGNRKWGPVIEHLLVCTESMLKGGKWARSVICRRGAKWARRGDSRQRSVVSYARGEALRRFYATEISQRTPSHPPSPKKKSKKTNKQKRQPVTNSEDDFRSCVSRVSSIYY